MSISNFQKYLKTCFLRKQNNSTLFLLSPVQCETNEHLFRMKKCLLSLYLPQSGGIGQRRSPENVFLACRLALFLFRAQVWVRRHDPGRGKTITGLIRHPVQGYWWEGFFFLCSTLARRVPIPLNRPNNRDAPPIQLKKGR